jgi:steroid delta-isomerase
MDLDGIVRFFETLEAGMVPRLGEIYTADASFKDPFNDVRTLADIQRIFAHMFEEMHEPRFKVMQRIVDGTDAVLIWDFTFRLRKFRPTQAWRIHGASHLTLAADGRIAHHRDYWDTGEELYAKLPGIGPVVRWLMRRMA